MPRTPETPEDQPQQAKTVDEVIAAANIPSVAGPPPAVPKQGFTPEEPQQGKMFMGRDGRNYWKYESDGETIILPKPIEQMKEQDFYDMPVSLMDNQSGRMPENLTVKFKDPQWAGYWFNRSAKFGARVSTGRSLGYVPAKREDLEWYCLELNDQDGAVEQHDLVLMKIPKYKLYAQYKKWIDQAKVQGGIEAYKNKALSELIPANRQQMPYYHTPQATGEYQGLGPVTSLPTVQN